LFKHEYNLRDRFASILSKPSTPGFLIAWWREGIGGTILVAIGIAHSAFAYIAVGYNKAFAVLVSGV